MANASFPIQCPNPACAARNALSQQFCQRCQTFLPKRYLWAVGALGAARPGDLLGDRYQLLHSQVLLDTQPGLLPLMPSELPPVLEAYLRLSPYQLHVPQIYGLLALGKGRSATVILLLEQAPIYPAEAGLPAIGATLMPDLVSLWPLSPPLRQLHWIWQMVQLWPPLSREQGVASLLNPNLLRVDGGYVRLLELEFDVEPPSLAQLGQFWQQTLPATAAIAPFWQPLCQQLMAGQINHPDQLLTRLNHGLAESGAGDQRQVQLATRTDQGPTRSRNEDACYPASGSQLTLTAETAPIVIVCDGIGGHEGGNVASNLAITTIESQLQGLPWSAIGVEPAAVFTELDQATFAANDVICQQNDTEARQERQRMGTTLVMGLVNGQDLYINHVGDSRAYRITRTGCYQVTLDDDVASREVRLGYALYRAALQQPAAGSLIQALGMSKSSFLHPTVQRFILDEDCVFLLCSDGLSDYDRIAECWATEIVPLLDRQVDIATVSRRLVEVANTRNGHDNVTIGLIFCQVTAGPVPTLTPVAPPELTSHQPVTSPAPIAAPPIPLTQSSPPTQLLSPPARATCGLPLLLTLLGLAVTVGLLASLLLPRSLAPVVEPSLPASPSVEPSITLTPPPARPKLVVGTLIQLTRPAALPDERSLILLRQAGAASAQALGQVAPGSVLQVVKQQGIANQGEWLQLKVCETADNAPNLLGAEAVGWQSADTIAEFTNANFAPTPEQRAVCGVAAASPIASPTAKP
jgi:protein phosphatase